MPDIVGLIKTFGYLGIFSIVFAESGLFIGFFLPGDSLLFTAGFLSSQGFLEIGLLAAVIFVGAVLGDNFGYAFGKRVGPSIFKKEDSFLFHKDNLERARMFYEKHGGKTIILARFIPFVRTFAPILGGVGKMEYKKFFLFNVLGGALWTITLTFLGYFLGNIIPDADKYVLPFVVGIILISLIPPIFHISKRKRYAEKIRKYLGPRTEK